MIRAIVTDIEGTTSSVSFVLEVLFPFARNRMQAFITTHADVPAVASEIAAVRKEIGNPLASLQEVIDTLLRWIDEDRKITPLKSLQGMIWADGYKNGELEGHVYEDVPGCLHTWKTQGLTLAVYSSGSIAAQKLIFGHTRFGDLTPVFSAYFDTTTGGKRENSSYVSIASALGMPAADVLFLSDIQQELDAAKAAGMHTIGLERLQRGVIQGHPVVTSFKDIALP